MNLKCGDKVSPTIHLQITIEPTDTGEIIEVNHDDNTVCVEFIQPVGNNLKVVVPIDLIKK